MNTKRLLLVASAGGHWVQLSRLSPAFEAYETLYVTTLDGARAPSGTHDVALIRDASRSNPALFLQLVAQLIIVMFKFRPDVVITTGAAPGLMAVLLGRLFGARTVWIDSIANSEKLSLSGRIAGRCADLWLTQWSHLARTHPRLQWFGAVL